jgi:Skp family chaperone for outer membrane proteins
MKPIVIAAGVVLTAAAAPGFAQSAGAAPASAPLTCFIEVSKLMAEPPAGVADLGAALRELDTRLRPQVEEIHELKAQIARLEQRQTEAGTGTEAVGFEGEGEGSPVALPITSDPTAEEIQRVQAELDAKQAQLKLDYVAQQTAIVGPVQARLSQGAQTYGTEQGCSEIRMARAPDLAALTAGGARDLTGGFVAWYTVNHPSAVLSSR